MGNPAAVTLGPGLLYVAAIGTTEPTTISGALPSAWTALGYTEDGTEINAAPSFEAVEVAEELTPLKYVGTSREDSVKFALAELTAQNLNIAFNGGTITGPTTGFVTFEPPALGDETRIMIIWHGSDNAERWLFRRCLQVGTIAIPRRKAPDKAVIPCEFKCEVPTDGSKPFKVFRTASLPYSDLNT